MKVITILLTTLFIVRFIPVFGQCINPKIVTYGGDYEFSKYIHRCPTYNFAYRGDTATTWNIMDNPIDIFQAPKEVLVLKQKVENQIKEFAGVAFYSKIRFNNVYVVYPESLKVFLRGGRQGVTLKYFKAKYYFLYEFKPDSLASFHIGIAVNNKGLIISKFNFPSKHEYKIINSNFSYCQLINIARKNNKSIDPIKEILLDYDNRRKRFYWQINQDLIDEKEGANYFNQILIDANDFTKTENHLRSVTVVY